MYLRRHFVAVFLCFHKGADRTAMPRKTDRVNLDRTTKDRPTRIVTTHDKAVIARALAVFDVTGSLIEASRTVKVHRDTVKAWIANRDALGFPASMAAQTLQDMYDDAKTDLLASNLKLQRRALKQIEATIDKANAYQAATIYGILTDKVAVMLNGDAVTRAEASVTPRADKLTDDDLDNLILLAAKIAKRRKPEDDVIDVEYTDVTHDEK
jgi:hypothetical protein